MFKILTFNFNIKKELNEMRQLRISGSQIELMLKKNEQKAEELTMTLIDKWNTDNLNNVISNALIYINFKLIIIIK